MHSMTCESYLTSSATRKLSCLRLLVEPRAKLTGNPMARRTIKRQIIFRLCAVLIGLLPFLAFEFFLGAIGWQQLDGVKDPFVGFSSSRPLFELNEDRTEYEISDSRKPLFCDESFPVEKSPDQFRIFCIGGSTVQGRPFAIETSFST